MAGLSDLITNTANQTTSMPAWYDTAQQNIVSQAGTAAGRMPSLQNTVAGQAINNLQGPNNPFFQAQGSLSQIASGAANPWIITQAPSMNQGNDPYYGNATSMLAPDAEGTNIGGMSYSPNGFPTNPNIGNAPGSYSVVPNPYTAMGGLFQAQNQQLQQLMPNYTAPVQGANIAGGNFGSLRGETAVNKAMADAQAKLFTDQMQAALQNQQTGVAAGTGLGNVGQSGTASMTTLGQAQQSDPFTAAANYGKIVGGIQAPTTQSNRTQLSPLNTLGSLATAGSTGYSAIDQALKSYGGIGGVLGKLFGGNSIGTNISGSGQTVQAIDTSTGGYGSPVTGIGAGGGAGLGQVLGNDGNIYNDPTYGQGSNNVVDPNIEPI